MTVPLSLSQWQISACGGCTGARCPRPTSRRRSSRPASAGSSSMATTSAILRYNCANAYALTVGVLSDRLPPVMPTLIPLAPAPASGLW